MIIFYNVNCGCTCNCNYNILYITFEVAIVTTDHNLELSALVA